MTGTNPHDLAVVLNSIAELERLGDEINELSAHLDAATARLLALIREFDARGGWNTGFRSCPLPDVPPPPAVPGDPIKALRACHDSQGLRLNARTACAEWLGERLDVGWAIDVLHPRARTVTGAVSYVARRERP